jgi:hypothetical protein
MARKLSKTKGRADTGRFCGIPHSLMDTPAYISLSPGAVKLFLDLLRQFNGRNNGCIVAVHSQLKQRGWAESSMHKALSELIRKGFLVRNFQGGLGPAGKKPSRYRFTFLPAEAPDFDCPWTGPSNEFRAWEPDNEN